METKIRELYADPSFVEALAQTKTFEEASELFAKNGVVISAEDLAEVAAEKDGEQALDEAQLENVSGGGWLLAGGLLVGGYIVGRLIVKVTK